MNASQSTFGTVDFITSEDNATFGTWIWDIREIKNADKVLSFLTSNCVNEIYLSYNPALPFSDYRSFVSKASAAKVRVSLIAADANWVLPEGSENRDRYFNYYKDYQSNAADNEKFYGMHMDIEPHQLAEWLTDNQTTVDAYCRYVLMAREIANETSTELELDIPCWFGGFNAHDKGEDISLTEFCIRHADTTLLMSYRDSAEGAASFATEAIDLSKKLNKKISLAFETGKIYENVNITFDHVGTVALCNELRELRRIMEQEHGLPGTGYAVHHYNSWIELPLYGNLKDNDFPYNNKNYAHLFKNYSESQKTTFAVQLPSELQHLQSGLTEIEKNISGLANGKINAFFRKEKGIAVKNIGGVCTVYFSSANELFRGIGLAEAMIINGETEISQKIPFDTLGVMYDCSRNSVPKVETVKKILIKTALMGYTSLMLYTEDTYTLKSHHEFGQYRGRYSCEELRQIDDYAYSLGIELIPCIQVLAHLERFLRWPITHPLRDNEFILMAEDKQTYALIEEMITSISSCVRSKRMHLGLDEAHGLGLGGYLAQNGYKRPELIMKTHLEAVGEICKKHRLKPMMWGDMIFRMNITGSGYYDENVSLPKGTGDIVPKDFDFIYWDYYHTDEAFYQKYITEHLKQGIKPLFAAGVCSWIGMVPNLVRTAVTTKNSVAAAKKNNLNEMFICVWKDDGGEALPGPDYLGLLMYAENCYCENGAIEKELKRNSLVMTGAEYESFMQVGSIDEIVQNLSLQGLEAPNPHKYFLWQDILLGQFDVEAASGNYASIYAHKAQKLKEQIESESYDSDSIYGLRLGYNLCKVLELKVDIGIRLKKAYDSADKASLKAIMAELRREYTHRINDLYAWHRLSWHHFYKPFGWEIADIKYGYLLARAKTAAEKIDAFLCGDETALCELDEERLTYFGTKADGVAELPHYNNFIRIATVGQI